MNESEIYQALLNYKRRAIETGEIGIIRHFRFGTGYDGGANNTIDAMAVSCWPGKGIEVVAYEIKTSIADFRAELKKPFKRLSAVVYSNRFYFLASAGVIPKKELPLEAGLLEVNPETKNIHASVAALRRELMPPNWQMFASIMRRLGRADVQLAKALDENTRMRSGK